MPPSKQNKVFIISLVYLEGSISQGKTFLLKVKRSHFQGKTDADDNTDITCFPRDMMTDTLDSAIITPAINNHDSMVNKSLSVFLKDYQIWVQMWKLSIAVTIINSKEFSHLYNNNDFKALNKISSNLLAMDNKRSRPCIVFSSLLNMNIRDLSIVIQDTNHFIHLLDKINSAVYIFIDKIEQAFSAEIDRYASEKKTVYQRSISYWQYAQYSLADAAYQLFSSVNSHIKVFYTIRHEALLGSYLLTPNTCQNIESYLTEIVYSQSDIFELFKLYIKNEEEENLAFPKEKETDPEKAFFGLNTISHAYVDNTDEKIFDYLYRHSLRRPRDVMAICRALYLYDPKKLNIQIIRHIINDKSNSVLNNYLQEVTPFITFNRKDVKRLLQCLNTNFFDFNYIQYVCERYNCFHSSSYYCHRKCNSCKNSHPFSTLYNIGLIGALKNSLADPVFEQRFLPLGESRLKISEYDLPNSPLYCLHPTLCDVARKERNNMHQSFTTTNEIISGEGIKTSDSIILKIQNDLPKRIQEMDNEKIFVSSTVYDLTKERQAIKKTLFSQGYYPVLSESVEFEYGSNDIDSHDHCIDELLKCKTMIFIIGTEYGGKYAGEKYSSYIRDIENDSKSIILEPSISLMEFYVAKRNNIKYYVFVKKEVLDEKKKYEQNKSEYKNKNMVEVFQIINFVNHIKVEGKRAGNWYITFKSVPDLCSRINRLSFNDDKP